MLFRQTDNLLEIILSLNKEYHIPRLIKATGKRENILRTETPQQFRLTENVPSQRMVTENHIFKIIEDQLRRIILIRLDFVNDHFRLLFYFMLRESRMEYNISEQFEGTFQMPGQEGGIDNRLLFIRIGIQIAAHIFHAVKDMPRFSLLRPFKNKMFHEMSHSLLILSLIARSGIDGKTTISYFRESRFMNYAQAIRQCIFVVMHCFLLPY